MNNLQTNGMGLLIVSLNFRFSFELQFILLRMMIWFWQSCQAHDCAHSRQVFWHWTELQIIIISFLKMRCV